MHFFQCWAKQTELTAVNRRCIESFRALAEEQDSYEFYEFDAESLSRIQIVQKSNEIRLLKAQERSDLVYSDCDVLWGERWQPENDNFIYAGEVVDSRDYDRKYCHFAFYVNNRVDLFVEVQRLFSNEYAKSYGAIAKILTRRVNQFVRPIPKIAYGHLNLTTPTIFL